MATRDFALDDDTGDLLLSGGDFVVTEGVDAIRQSLKIRLQFFQNEWFADLDAGVPFLQEIVGKKKDLNVLRTLYRQAILETPGVLDILQLDLSLDSRTRTLTVTLRVSSDLGEIEV